MPVIIASGDYDLWLDPGMQSFAAVSELLKPYDPGSMRLYPVSMRVNSTANDDEEWSRPIQLAETRKRNDKWVVVQFEPSHLAIAMEALKPASLKAMPLQSNKM